MIGVCNEEAEDILSVNWLKGTRQKSSSTLLTEANDVPLKAMVPPLLSNVNWQPLFANGIAANKDSDRSVSL